MTWNQLFAYKTTSTGSVFDTIHYIVSRIAFSWNANNHQKAIYQEMLEKVHDERLALSYTYSNINHEDSFNYIDNEQVQFVESNASTDESIWHVSNPTTLNLYKLEFIEEDKRWAQEGLTQAEINDRRNISKKDIERSVALSTKVLHRIKLFDETDIVVYDKIYGYYTIELQGPYWSPWERPIYRWYYKGDEEMILSNVKGIPAFEDVEWLHQQYVTKQKEKQAAELRHQKFLEETAQARRELEEFATIREEHDLLKRLKEREDPKPRPRYISCKKQIETVNHVRAAMGQSSKIDTGLMDDSIF